MNSGFLAEKEVHSIRPLWEQVFAEDSKAFTEYYFGNKAERNLVFTRMEGEDIVSMLHLAPYMTGRMESVCYIVGVATKEAYRRQGLMADMMKEALQFMRAEGQPFTFLMPANPAYYLPFQFTYIYDKPAWKINESVLPTRYLDAGAQYNAEFHLVVKDKGTLQMKAVKEADYAKKRQRKSNARCRCGEQGEKKIEYCDYGAVLYRRHRCRHLCVSGTQALLLGLREARACENARAFSREPS